MRVSPAAMPSNCSSKPGMNVFEPIVTWIPSPVPPSNGVPLMVPLKEIVTRSPVSAFAPSPFAANARFWSAIRLIASSTSASVTSATGFSTVKPLKSASWIGGTTSIETV